MNYVPKVNCPVCGSLTPETDRTCADGLCETRNEKKRVYIRAYQELHSKEMPLMEYQSGMGLLMIFARRLRDEGIVFFEYCATWGCYELRKEKPKNPAYKQSRYCVTHAAKAKKEFDWQREYTQKLNLQRERA
jgi:hypothetical protein